ncbi:PREDICTED: ankyrin [Prunus dulcis]|uniref:PREDICTED: ankyrin n=1 Tax=Prunus dulcis TaxID=3755 RepID=A0A5E4E803_PRUDU|nr:ankyrin repeat-containing protein BDA1 [Prunus dulcis]KAI5346775.1 hypothetical protein L3X38_014654 [Prunus dulcis]VVA10851.1 PREDICTED: ankyrin [Prunus dulcis]
MDIRLFEASHTGDVQLLHQLLAENPLLLHSLALAFTENPLHVASTAGHVDFVKEIVRLKPAFVRELNQEGFSPMHIASANGYFEIVRELLKVDQILCRLNGRDQWTPLHYAAARGRVDVVGEMVLACPESVEDVTIQGETALHLAVKNSQFEAIKVAVELAIQLRKANVLLNMKDKHGNTALHLATWKKQHQVVEWLVGINRTTPGALEINNVNQSGLTPLDLLLILPSEAGDREIHETLRRVGSSRAQDIAHSAVPSLDSHILSHCPMASETPQPQQPNNLMEYFKFKKGRDSPSDARTALLVVAVLVATATFQVGLSPPNGVWQDNAGLTKNGTGSAEPARLAGKSIMGSYNAVLFVIFVSFNSIGFSVSLHMISVLTSNFPLQLELQICVVAMYVTYNTAMINIAPDNTTVLISVFTAVLPTLVSVAAKWGRHFFMRLREFLAN